jgi:hypothetical protein
MLMMIRVLGINQSIQDNRRTSIDETACEMNISYG